MLGTCWLQCHWPDWMGAELGHQLSLALWGHGYATEAARALVAFGFETVGVRRIWARINPGNAASCRAGLCREGHRRRCEFAAGEWRDLYLYAGLADERGVSSRPP